MNQLHSYNHLLTFKISPFGGKDKKPYIEVEPQYDKIIHDSTIPSTGRTNI